MAQRMNIICLILLLTISLNDCLKILVFFPLSAKSHSILGHGVVRNLLEAGHEVTHITSFPAEKPHPKLKEIVVGEIGQIMKQDKERYELFKLKNLVGKKNMADSTLILYFAYDFHRRVFEYKPVVDFLSDPKEQFDAVVVEWFFSDYSAGIAPLFKCPLIWIGSTEAHWQFLKIIDEVPNPSYTVDLFSANRAPLSLWERIVEMFVLIKKYLLVNLILVPFEKSIYSIVFPPIAAKRGVEMPSYNEAIYNGSMALLNSHPSIGTPFRLPQNAKYVAGYHINTKVAPLPKDLQKIMDEAKHGVIYFSMGSNLKSAEMSEYMRDTLLDMFGKLKQVVVWKFEEDLKQVPPNVHLVKWSPQQSILAHPNIKLFITHGGQLSTTEAVHFGVPVIGIPVLGDQYVNMRSVTTKGFGLSVTLAEDMAGPLLNAIREMMTNDSYKLRVKELSAWFHDRLKPPGEELVHWIEYAVKTKGAPHLRSPALHVPCYQKMHLDIIAIFVLLIILVIIGIRRWWRSRNKKAKDQKKDKKKTK